MCVRCGTGRIAWCTDPSRHGEYPASRPPIEGLPPGYVPPSAALDPPLRTRRIVGQLLKIAWEQPMTPVKTVTLTWYDDNGHPLHETTVIPIPEGADHFGISIGTAGVIPE